MNRSVIFQISQMHFKQTIRTFVKSNAEFRATLVHVTLTGMVYCTHVVSHIPDIETISHLCVHVLYCNAGAYRPPGFGI